MKRKPSCAFALLACLLPVPALAQLISDHNIFNNGSQQATVTMNTEYSDGTFPHEDAVDLGGAQVYFGDYLRDGGSYTTIDDQLMTISGFDATSGINSIRFYQGQYEPGRVADQVTIYYSLSNTTSQDPSSFVALNGGNPFTLALTSPYGTYTTTGADGVPYDTLTGLNIPTGAQSILLDFGAERYAYGQTSDNDYYVGVGFTEIQAFAAAPEPSVYALTASGLLALAGIVQLRRLA